MTSPAARRESRRNPAVGAGEARADTTPPVVTDPWALLELARWCAQRPASPDGGPAPCPDTAPTPRPPAPDAPAPAAGLGGAERRAEGPPAPRPQPDAGRPARRRRARGRGGRS